VEDLRRTRRFWTLVVRRTQRTDTTETSNIERRTFNPDCPGAHVAGVGTGVQHPTFINVQQSMFNVQRQCERFP